MVKRLLLAGCGLCLALVTLAEDTEEAPDAAFLEYLGMWEETDEDWLLLAEMEEEAEDEESPENDDED